MIARFFGKLATLRWGCPVPKGASYPRRRVSSTPRPTGSIA